MRSNNNGIPTGAWLIYRMRKDVHTRNERDKEILLEVRITCCKIRIMIPFDFHLKTLHKV